MITFSQSNGPSEYFNVVVAHGQSAQCSNLEAHTKIMEKNERPTDIILLTRQSRKCSTNYPCQ
jgi:hypothetical protein